MNAVNPPAPRVPWLVVGLCWLLAVGFIALAAWNDAGIIRAASRFESLCRLSPANEAGRGACAALAAAAPPLMFDPDAYCWITLAQEHQRLGAWRVKTYPFDNAPHGREEHWSQSLAWWLWMLGAATHAVTGAPMEAAIAQASLWANPLLFALFLLGLGAGLHRRLGAWPAGILLITLASLWGVQWDFSYGRPDHHGLHLIAFLGMTLCAMAGGLGWARDEEEEEAGARRWFAASGLFGAMGLWIGATQQCIGIGALGVGATIAALVYGGRGRFAPERWLRWARFGAAGSLAFYLVEYFPHGMAMRLEVNHPLYALAWLGGGELMWVIGRWRADGRAPVSARWRGPLALAAMAALPATVLLGPREWCVLRDPWLAHVFGIASEGLPWLKGHGWPEIATQVWHYTGALLLTLPLAVALLLGAGRSAPTERKAAILTVLPLAAIFLGWTLLQIRWMGFLEASLALLALAIGPARPAVRRGALPLGLLALTVPGWLGNCALHCRALVDDPMNHGRAILTEATAIQEVAWNLRLLAGPGARPARVLAPFGASPPLHYFGGVNAVGSFYWDNLEGARAALAFYEDKTDAQARRITRERGLDYVIAVARTDFVFENQKMLLGRVDQDAARGTLAYRLANPLGARPPAWLEAAPLLDAPVAIHQGYRLYRVRRELLGD